MMTLRNLIASAPVLLVALGPLAAPAQTDDGAPAVKLPKLAPRPQVPDLEVGPGAPRLPNVPVVPLDKKRLAKGDDEDDKARRRRRARRAAKRDKPVAVAQRDDDRGTGKTPRWRQVDDDDEPERPTLSADFIKNCQRLRPGVKVHLDIYDEDLEAVVKLIACMTGKNIILADSLKGKKITIYSPTLVTVAEAERAFYTALDANGYTVSRRGQFLKIVPSKEYQSQPDGIVPPGADMPPNLDRMETRIVPLRYVDAQEITEVLSKLASPNASFIAYSPTNSLIITELSSNLRKLLELIRMLDVEGSEEQVWIYQVLNAEAQDIAQKILEIFENREGAGGGGARRPPRRAKRRRSKRSEPTSTAVGSSDTEVSVSKVVADERTNRLIIVATARSYRRIKRLIARLDVAIPGDGQVHIHQLHHAKAEDLANVLSNLSQKAQQRQSGRRRPSRSRRASKGGKGQSGDASAMLFEGEVSVTADEDTNTLVITSSLKDYLALKNVIEVLDQPRRQVFIEAVVMEVSIRNDRKFGLGFHGALEGPTVAGEGVPLIIGHRPGELNTLNLASAATLQGLAVAAIGPSKTIAGLGEIPSFGAILRALATSNDSNILSTPHILTTDNEEAEIVVGQNVPFVSGFVGGAASLQGLGNNANNLGGGLGALGGFFPSVSVQRQDVALTLKITPRINDENFVTLEVEQVIEEVDSIDPVVGPTTSKRSVKTTVVVKDQNTVVIGGLQRSQQLNSESKVPILGEIPVIGYLFRDTTKTRERRNLLLLLTPHVIEGPDDFRAIFKRKLEEHREFVARFHKKGDVFVVGIDYGKKHGVLEAIHQSIREAREEEELLERLRRQQDGPPLPQDVDGVPIDGEEPPRPSGVIDGEVEPAGEDGPADGGGPSPVPPPVDGPLGQAPIEEGDRL